MSTVGRAFGIAAGLLALLPARTAVAEDGVAAQALFEAGVRDLEAGRYEKACPALAESQRLDPHPGTLFALAECEAKSGKVASAVGHYQDYLGLLSRMSPEQLERHAERAATARAQVESLRSSVPTLALILPQGAPPELEVERDGVRLEGAALGMALPLDPGEHTVVTRLPGAGEKRTTLSLAPSEKKELVLELPAAPAASAPPPPPHASGPSAQPNPLRTWGWAVGAVGLAGVATGSVTGVLVLRKKATVTDHCVGSACDPEGKAAADSGQTLATVSTVAFAVGLSAVAASIVMLIVTEPASNPRAAQKLTPRVAAGPTGVWAGLERRF